MSDARGRRERLYHPEGGHTSTDLDILSEPAARSLAIARLEAEAEEARREAERVELAAIRRAELITAAEAENHRRDVLVRVKVHRYAKRDLVQQTEPRLFKPPPKLREIARAVADYYGVTVLELAGSGRKTRITRPRQVFCYIARKLTFKSFPDLGRALGGRDHTTTLWAFNKISTLIVVDQKLAAEIESIRAKLGGA